MRKSLGSEPTLPTCTVSSPSSRSSWFLKLMVLRRYGSPPGTSETESALARFSATTRRRCPWARMPAAEIIRLSIKSIGHLLATNAFNARLRAAAQRHFEKVDVLAIKVGHEL